MESEKRFKIEGESEIEETEVKKYKEDNVVSFETPEGKYKMVYGYHDTERKGEDIKESDAIILEFPEFDYSDPLMAEAMVNTIAKGTKEYRRIIEVAEKEKKSIFLADVTSTDTFYLLHTGLKTVENTIGAMLLLSLGSDILEKLKSDKRVTRREFFKKTLKGLAGLYFLSHIPPRILEEVQRGKGNETSLDENSATRAIDRFLDDLNEKIHPETEEIIITLRNYIIAQKMKTIAEMLSTKDKKAEVASVVGAAHHGIEKALLKDDRERLELITKILSARGLEKMREKIATIARLDFNENKNRWEATVFKDPNLSSIEKEKEK